MAPVRSYLLAALPWMLSAVVPAVSQSQPQGYRASSSQFCTPHVISSEELKTDWNDFVEKVHYEKAILPAFQQYVHENLTRHTNNVPGPECQAECTARIWERVFAPVNFTIFHQILDVKSGLGWLHTRAVNTSAESEGDVTAVFDLFRWENGCIVEHWDAFQMRAVDAVGGTSLF